MLSSIGSPKQIFQNEDRVRRAFGQAAHQIGIPLRAEGDVDAHAPAVTYKLLLQVAAHAIEHLKLERFGADLLGPSERDGRVDHLWIVRSDSVVGPALE